MIAESSQSSASGPATSLMTEPKLPAVSSPNAALTAAVIGNRSSQRVCEALALAWVLKTPREKRLANRSGSSSAVDAASSASTASRSALAVLLLRASGIRATPRCLTRCAGSSCWTSSGSKFSASSCQYAWSSRLSGLEKSIVCLSGTASSTFGLTAFFGGGGTRSGGRKRPMNAQFVVRTVSRDAKARSGLMRFGLFRGMTAR
mmetsp:Transcript_151881/g.268200  ORF Transcript_151881/g.268200 Transcript_151881/m.268200 type:complete len:204 (+) Transcript_151881:530-1141(+)